WAQHYLGRGWACVPVPRGKKAPTIKEWQKLRLTGADVARYFSPEGNIGLLLGDPSGGLVDIDLDAPEALQLADDFLPPTLRVHGRSGKPRSHRWYVVTGPAKTERFRDLDGPSLLELRSTGGQTLTPPSIPPSGEVLAWEAEGNPAI